MKQLGIISIVLYWSTAVFVLYTKRLGSSYAISDHVTTGFFRKLYLVLSLISFMLFFMFGLFWLLPEFNSNVVGYVLLVIALIAEVITTLVPRLGTRIKAHDTFANIAGTTASLILPLLALSSVTNNIQDIVLWSTTATIVAIGIYIREVNRSNYLHFQVLFYVLFHSAILFVAYS
jgi:hypothetical protein